MHVRVFLRSSHDFHETQASIFANLPTLRIPLKLNQSKVAKSQQSLNILTTIFLVLERETAEGPVDDEEDAYEERGDPGGVHDGVGPLVTVVPAVGRGHVGNRTRVRVPAGRHPLTNELLVWLFTHLRRRCHARFLSIIMFGTALVFLESCWT